MKSELASSNLKVLENENRERQNKKDFRQAAIGDSTRLHYEPCSQTESELQGQRTGEYMVRDNFGRMCEAPEALHVSLYEKGNLFRDGYGWTSDSGCNIDKDSAMRNADRLTNKRLVQQLFTRPYNGVPYMGSGSGQGEVKEEDTIRPGLQTTTKRPCNVLSGVSIHPERMKHCLYHDPQDVGHIIPLWTWGGDDTRMAMRKKYYNKRCGYNTK